MDFKNFPLNSKFRDIIWIWMFKWAFFICSCHISNQFYILLDFFIWYSKADDFRRDEGIFFLLQHVIPWMIFVKVIWKLFNLISLKQSLRPLISCRNVFSSNYTSNIIFSRNYIKTFYYSCNQVRLYPRLYQLLIFTQLKPRKMIGLLSRVNWIYLLMIYRFKLLLGIVEKRLAAGTVSQRLFHLIKSYVLYRKIYYWSIVVLYSFNVLVYIITILLVLKLILSNY